ncbi:hypothetical protein CVV38_00820 [Candidatus Peregrinibacteria bacterium HGW-Peregrinibacteria-1]|jgi:hypothetical protein|nr:MAG: hypothetical protein CVV38_00820 [Candidatus Peregrinibacteria bacterium HGW-Peregrinibacteria-1]
MADQVVQVTKTGYGSRLMGSIKGIGFGLLLFLASFFVLFSNEGTDSKSEILVTSQEIVADSVGNEGDGAFVRLAGKLETSDSIGDGLFLNPGNYLVVDRKVEMYGWKEVSSSKTETKLGGSQETTTTYSYEKEWSSSPASSSSFNNSAGHENPSMRYAASTSKASSARVGAYDVDTSSLAMPSASALSLADGMVDLSSVNGAYVEGNYVYVPVSGGSVSSSETVTSSTTTNFFEDDVAEENDFFGEEVDAENENDFFGETTTVVTSGRNVATSPEVGDLRITYSVLNSGVDGTLFGKKEGAMIKPYVATEFDNENIYRFYNTSFEGALGAEDSAHGMKVWILRLVGFLMMWTGLSMVLAPLSVLLDIIPFLGAVSRGFVGMITFITALVLSIVTILVSMLLHSMVAMVVAVVVVLGLMFVVVKNKGKKNA